MATRTFECWVYPEDADNTFSIEIALAKRVSHLKEAIKDKKSPSFDHIAANELELYSIPQLGTEDFISTLEQWKPHEKTKLVGRKELSDLFPESDEQEWVIVVVDPSSSSSAKPSVVVSDITLNCWVHGQEINRAFPVEISSKKTVGILRKVIKEKKQADFHDVDADALDLYKVSLPWGEKTLRGLTLDRKEILPPLEPLSRIFPKSPTEGHVHVVIEAPLHRRSYLHPPSSYHSLLTNNIKARRRAFLANSLPIHPSSNGNANLFSTRQSQPDRAILCNRPSTAVATIPSTLLHAVFGEFLDDCMKHESTPDDKSFAMQLQVATSGFYPDEATRADIVLNVLSAQGLDFIPSTTEQGYVTEGDISVHGHRYAIGVFKKQTGVDPYSQASLYYLELTRMRADELWHSPLPCIMILLFGPYMGFAGAAWNLRPVVQMLSALFPMYCDPTDTRIQTLIACHLGAFRKAVNKLELYYTNLVKPPLSGPNHSQLFPHPIAFRSLLDQHEQTFEYVSQPFDDKLVFFGTLSDERPVIIKFVRQYSKDAHLECASLGCAPTLLGFEQIPGEWFMVVMDRLLQDHYSELHNCRPGPSLIDNIRKALVALHQRGYVHGDIREPNIMVLRPDNSQFMLIDFDWAGEIGNVRYPMNVDQGPDLWRPEDAVDGTLILAKHDIQMLDHIEIKNTRMS